MKVIVILKHVSCSVINKSPIAPLPMTIICILYSIHAYKHRKLSCCRVAAQCFVSLNFAKSFKVTLNHLK